MKPNRGKFIKQCASQKFCNAVLHNEVCDAYKELHRHKVRETTGAQEKAGVAPKEAFTPETIYRVCRNPYSDSRESSYLLQAYMTQESGWAKMGDVLYTGTSEKYRELMR